MLSRLLLAHYKSLTAEITIESSHIFILRQKPRCMALNGYLGDRVNHLHKSSYEPNDLCRGTLKYNDQTCTF